MALKAKIKIEADTKQAEAALKRTGTTADKSFKKIEASGAAATGGLAKLGSGFTSLLAKASALTVGFAIVVRGFKSAIDAAAVQQAAITKLDAALSSLGPTADSVSAALQRQASELQKVTRFGDEETIQAQALIAAFVKEESQLLELTRVTQDFAEAKGVSLANAADLITKTFASSTNALTRYGLEVEGAAGSTERLESLTSALDAAFAGAAEAGAKDFQGRLDQLNNSLGDLLEKFGENVTGSELVNASLVGARKATDAYVESTDDATDAQKAFNETIQIGTTNSLEMIVRLVRIAEAMLRIKATAGAATSGIIDWTGAVEGTHGPLEDQARLTFDLDKAEKERIKTIEEQKEAVEAALVENKRYLQVLIDLGLITKETTASLEDNKRTLADVTRAFDEGTISQEKYLDQYERLQNANIELRDTQEKTTAGIVEGEIPAVRDAIDAINDETQAVERLIEVERRRTEQFVQGAFERQAAEDRVPFSERSGFSNLSGGTFTIAPGTFTGANGRVNLAGPSGRALSASG